MYKVNVQDMGKEKLFTRRLTFILSFTQANNKRKESIERARCDGKGEKGTTTIPHLISFMFECYLALFWDLTTAIIVMKQIFISSPLILHVGIMLERKVRENEREMYLCEYIYYDYI